MENKLICQLIYQIYRKLRKQFLIKSDNQLTIFQIHILYYLKENGSASTNEIADFFEISLPATTLSLKKLINEELIRKDFAIADERKKILTLTEKGEDLIKKINYKKMENVKLLLSSLTKKEKNTLVELLKKVVNN